eukprot:7061955-Karenia_brevis.AAC.1
MKFCFPVINKICLDMGLPLSWQAQLKTNDAQTYFEDSSEIHRTCGVVSLPAPRLHAEFQQFLATLHGR